MFNGLFGKIANGMCRLTLDGDIAVKTNSGYRSYNVKEGVLTNVTNFCFDIGEEFFFLIPTNKVLPGDIILVDGKPKCVISCDSRLITAIDYESSEVRQILPEHHALMGNVYFYGKIVSIFGNQNFIKSPKGMNKMMKMMMLTSMMGGKSGDNNGFSQMLPMMMMMNGGNGMNELFEGLFDQDAQGDESNLSDQAEEREEK